MVDARHASDGDTMHRLFSVIVPTPREDGSFVVLALEDVLERPEEYAPYLMPNPYGESEDRDSLYSYKVIERSADWQIIEVVEAYRDGDNTIWSRYRATADGIEPISSRMMYFGYAFAALPYALGLTFLLYVTGRILGWRNRAIMQAQ